MWCFPGNVTPQAAGVDTSWSFQVGQEDGYLWNADFSHADHKAKCREVISADYGVTLQFEEGESGTGDWMPKSTTRYKFYHSTTFDGNQESLPSAFTMYPTKNAAGAQAHASIDEMYFADRSDSLALADNAISVAASEVPVTFGLLVRMTNEHNPDGPGVFDLGASNYDSAEQNAVDDAAGNQEYNFFGQNQRVTGGHIWWASNEDGYSNLYLLAQYDLEKGAKLVGASGAEGSGTFSEWKGWVYPPASNPVVRPAWFEDGIGTLNGPPIFITYEALFGYSHDTKLNAKWKTSTIANGRAYIGNILRQEKSIFDGGGSWEQATPTTKDIAKQGAIVGSPVGRYDTFPEDPNYEFTTSPGDGDKIIKLESFADRLICFYSNKLEVYNIEKGFENLELEIKNMGLDGENPQQACLTDAGVAWINSYGAHFYNGQQVKTISDKIRNQWIGEDGYTAFWTTSDVPAIAYDPRAQKLLIAKKIKSHADDNDILEFSFKTQSWAMKEDALDASKDKRFTIYKGDLIFDNQVQVQSWSDTPNDGGGSGKNTIYTKDIDFGTPAIRKKIYKVYITYQSGGQATEVEVKYGIDADTTPTETFKAGTNFGNSVASELDAATGWQVAELRPSSSIKNAKSFRLAFTSNASVPKEFQINDITIIYRTKSIK